MTSFPARRSRSVTLPNRQPPWVVVIVMVLLLPGRVAGWTVNDACSVLCMVIPFLLVTLVFPVAA
jgi:hypothetical protein